MMERIDGDMAVLHPYWLKALPDFLTEMGVSPALKDETN
jgi:hypothetical protein